MSQAAAPLCRPSLGKASMAGHGTSCQRRQWIRVLWSHDHHDPKQTAALGGGQALTHVLGQPGCREPRAQRSLCRSVTPQRRESNCTAANARFDSHPRPAHRRLPNSSGDSNQMSIA